jgi:hypothetical protein
LTPENFQSIKIEDQEAKDGLKIDVPRVSKVWKMSLSVYETENRDEEVC